MLLRILFAIAFIPAVGFLYFFSLGLVDGTVTGFNIELWLAILIGIGAVLTGAILLAARGRRGLAALLLLVLAAPTLLAGLYLGMVLFSHSRWN